MVRAEKEVVLYFAGWNLNRENTGHSGEVCALPWEHVSCINHAFWAVEPADGTTETSVQRRLRGAPARTAWRIVPLHPECDETDTAPSAVSPELPRGHFAQYAAMHAKWPDVRILLSIGGWTRCGFFSEMAAAPEGRASFIESCLAVLRRYVWLDGLDIDWEYPACARQADADDPDGDEGCAVFASEDADRENFTALLRELRAAMDAAFGKNEKRLTACASGAVDGALARQNWAAAAPYLDFINIMSYDLAGVWDGVSGHASGAAKTAEAAAYLMQAGVPAEKICIGSPLYGTVMRLKDVPDGPESVFGAPVEPVRPVRTPVNETMLCRFAAEAVSGYTLCERDGRIVMDSRFDRGGGGWHTEYDAQNGAAWMYNDAEGSKYARWFISYEDLLSLQEKLDMIHKNGLGGMIVWEADQDTENNAFLAQMDRGLRANDDK